MSASGSASSADDIVRAARADAPSVSELVRTPAALLVVIVGLSTVVRALLAIRVPAPWILPDEALYAELARSVADGDLPAVRGVTELGWGVVYPIVIAPAWAAFDDPVHAYHATVVINSLTMSLAAVPAYLLGRLFVSRRSSMTVALMTVLVPSMGYTVVVMTENAGYPLFLLAVLFVARAVRRPTLGNQALVVLGLGLLILTRAQGVALVGTYAGAVALLARARVGPERRQYVRRFAPTGMLLAGLLALVAVAMVRRDGADWLGPRSGTFRSIELHEIPMWLAYLVAGLLLYVAIIPAVASTAVIVDGLSRRAPERVRLFAAVVLPTLVSMLGAVALVSASIDVDGTENLNERYLFYVVPLLFIGLALWIEEPSPRSRWWGAVVAACCVLAMSLPIERLAYNAEFQSLALLPWHELALPRPALAAIVGVFALYCGAVWLWWNRRRAWRLWLVVGAWLVLVGVVADDRATRSASYFARAFADAPASWVDDAVPDGTPVSMLWDQRRAREPTDDFYYWLLVTEFFNTSVGDVYRIGPPTDYESVLPTEAVQVRPNDTIRLRAARASTPRFVLVTCRSPVDGEIIASAGGGALRIVEVSGVLRLSPGRGCTRPTP